VQYIKAAVHNLVLEKICIDRDLLKKEDKGHEKSYTAFVNRRFSGSFPSL